MEAIFAALGATILLLVGIAMVLALVALVLYLFDLIVRRDSRHDRSRQVNDDYELP